jgi:hypothetical protein
MFTSDELGMGFVGTIRERAINSHAFSVYQGWSNDL